MTALKKSDPVWMERPGQELLAPEFIGPCLCKDKYIRKIKWWRPGDRAKRKIERDREKHREPDRQLRERKKTKEWNRGANERQW